MQYWKIMKSENITRTNKLIKASNNFVGMKASLKSNLLNRQGSFPIRNVQGKMESRAIGQNTFQRWKNGKINGITTEWTSNMGDNREDDTLPKRSGQKKHYGSLSANLTSSFHVEANDWDNI